VPIPGLLDNLRPTVQAARSSSPPPLFPSTAQLLASAAAALPSAVAVERRLIQAATPAVEQLSSVLGEVGDGVTEFTPTPAESRALIAEGYRVRRSLLVRFEDDGIDETGEMARLLEAALAVGGGGGEEGGGGGSEGRGGDERGGEGEGSGAAASSEGEAEGAAHAATSSGEWSAASSGAESSSSDGEGGWGAAAAAVASAGQLPRVRELVLPGTHLTPCGSDVDFNVGPAGLVLGGVDAALQRARADSQADVRRLVAEVAGFVNAVAAEVRLGGGRK